MGCNEALLQHSLDRAHSRHSTFFLETLDRLKAGTVPLSQKTPAYTAGTC